MPALPDSGRRLLKFFLNKHAHLALAVDEHIEMLQKRDFRSLTRLTAATLEEVADAARVIGDARLAAQIESAWLTLLDAGVCRDLAFDAQTAARAGRTSTGHGCSMPR